MLEAVQLIRAAERVRERAAEEGTKQTLLLMKTPNKRSKESLVHLLSSIGIGGG